MNRTFFEFIEDVNDVLDMTDMGYRKIPPANASFWSNLVWFNVDDKKLRFKNIHIHKSKNEIIFQTNKFYTANRYARPNLSDYCKDHCFVMSLKNEPGNLPPQSNDNPYRICLFQGDSFIRHYGSVITDV